MCGTHDNRNVACLLDGISVVHNGERCLDKVTVVDQLFLPFQGGVAINNV